MEKLNFNRYAKNELLTTEFENKCCATAWLSAAIKAIGSLRILKNKTELVFESQDYEIDGNRRQNDVQRGNRR